MEPGIPRACLLILQEVDKDTLLQDWALGSPTLMGPRWTPLTFPCLMGCVEQGCGLWQCSQLDWAALGS